MDDSPRKLVAVIVPVHRAGLSPDEEVSFRRMRNVLAGHDTFLVAPRDLRIDLDGVPVKRFPERFFRHLRAYSDLLLSRSFYEAFAEYDYILVHQLDCLVVSDDLGAWCNRGYDYVGAPWVRPGPDGAPAFTGVGNGGFSLRRVRTCLEVLAARDQRARAPVRAFHRSARLIRRSGRLLPWIPRAARALITQPIDRPTLAEKRRYALQKADREVHAWPFEDKFWSYEAPKLHSDFRIPPPEVAATFAFEAEPRFCLQQTDGRLPFGCHAWTRYDREFWQERLPIAVEGANASRSST